MYNFASSQCWPQLLLETVSHLRGFVDEAVLTADSLSEDLSISTVAVASLLETSGSRRLSKQDTIVFAMPLQ